MTTDKLASSDMGDRTQSLNTLLDHLPLGLAFFDDDLRCVRLNAELAAMYGRTVDSSIGVLITELMPQSAAELRPPIAQVFASGVGRRNIEIGERSPRDHDTVRHLLISVYPVREDAVIALVGLVVHDITERKLSEERLQQLQTLTARFAEIQTLAEVRQIILDDLLLTLGASTGVLRRLVDGALVIEQLEMMTTPSDADRRRVDVLPVDAQHPAAEAARRGSSCFIADTEAHLQRYPGMADVFQHFAIQASAHLPLWRGTELFGILSLGFPQAHRWDEREQDFMRAIADRTAVAYERARLLEAERQARREAEEANTALHASEARYRSLVETSAQVVWRADAQGKLFDRRLRWSRITGIRLEDLPPEPLDLIHPDDRVQGSQAWWEAVQRVEPISFEQRVRAADGNYHTWQVRGAPVFEADGRLREWVGTDTDITAHRQAEQALRESEQQLRLITDGMPALISYVDGERRYRFVNKTYTEWFGLQREEVIGRYMWDILGEAAYAAARSYIDEALAGRGVSYERVLPYKHGGARFVQATYIPDHADTGGVNGFFVLVIDLTERKQAEDRLRYQSRLLEALTGSVLDGILVVSPQERILHYNQQFLDIWGFPPDVLASQSDERALAWAAEQTADPAAFLSRVNTIYEQYDHQFREELLMRDGRVYERFGAPIQDGESRLGWLWTFRDITERKQAEVALREAQTQRLAEEQQQAERLRQLNVAALAIIAAASRDEVLQLIAHWARSLIGTTQAVVNLVSDGDWSGGQIAISLAEVYRAWQNYRSEITGAGIYQVVYNEQSPLRLTHAELINHPAWRAFSGEGERHPPLNGLLAVPLIDSDGNSIGVLQVSDKISGIFTPPDEALLVQLAQLAAVALENQTLYEQEQAARAQAEEASRLKDEFLATVSHELRTPLTAFLGYAQMLQMRQRDSAYISRTVEKMVRSAKAQAQLIEDLLDIARVVSGRLRIEPTLLDLTRVIGVAIDTVRPTIDARGLQLLLNLDPAGSAVMGDANRVQQIVWNLLTNAAKFTDPGGTITVLLQRDAHEAVITVSDTGQGISPDFLPYVFDRFRQADVTTHRTNSGLGIGLAIVRYLVELHGGRVSVQSAGLGQGASFTVRLPLANTSVQNGWPDQVRETTQTTDCPPVLVGLRVLVVDDQAEIRELIEEILTSCGALVHACGSAQEAFAAVQRWQPQVLVSDIAMPGEDGYWLIERVRALPAAEGGTVPALALTAYARLDDRLQVLASGFEQYVPKPVDPAELCAVVAQLARSAETP
jgi:PAS domain S-box-containing protein